MSRVIAVEKLGIWHLRVQREPVITVNQRVIQRGTVQIAKVSVNNGGEHVSVLERSPTHIVPLYMLDVSIKFPNGDGIVELHLLPTK